MDLEERTLETVGEHCEECGAKLTDAELKQAMEAGGPVLCTVHAAEATPLNLGWRWQRVDLRHEVLSQDEPRCFGCHDDCGVPPDGYAGTCAVAP